MLQSYAAKFDDPLAQAIRAGTVRVEETSFGAHVEGASQIRVNDTWGDMELHRYRVNRMSA